MELNHHFTVPVSIDQAWKILTDVERIAPCLPGAELQEIEGDTYRGVVKVKVGPIQAQFKGQASFVERDDAAYKIVLKGEGRDTGGKEMLRLSLPPNSQQNLQHQPDALSRLTWPSRAKLHNLVAGRWPISVTKFWHNLFKISMH